MSQLHVIVFKIQNKQDVVIRSFFKYKFLMSDTVLYMFDFNVYSLIRFYV